MFNRFGIPDEDLKKIRDRDKNCVYCHKVMINPYANDRHNDSATIEHLKEEGPFYMKNGLKIEDIAICCGKCNSRRGRNKLLDWFKTKYCIDNKINEETVADVVKEHLKRISNLTS